VLALDGVFDTGLATVLDAFETANELAEMSGLAWPRFDVAIVGVRKAVKTSQGLIVPVAAAPMRIIPDWVVVPAIGFKMPGPLQAALLRSDVSDAGETLRWWAERGAAISPVSKNFATSFSLPALASKRANNATVYIGFLLS